MLVFILAVLALLNMVARITRKTQCAYCTECAVVVGSGWILRRGGDNVCTLYTAPTHPQIVPTQSRRDQSPSRPTVCITELFHKFNSDWMLSDITFTCDENLQTVSK